MLSRSRSFLGILAVAAGLVVMTAAMRAATPDSGGARPALGFRFDDAAYAISQAPDEAAGAEKLSRISIRLYGAWSRVAAKDVNDGADGLFELFALYGTLGAGGVAGGYEPVHGGADFGGDVVYQLNSKIGVGLGAGYMRYSEDSLMALALGTSAFILEGAPTLSAIPVRLGIFLTVPVADKIDLTANAGGTLYAGLKLEARERFTSGEGEWQEMALEGSQTRFSNLGVQGGLGFEYRLSRRLGLFFEGEARYAKLGNFDSVKTSTETSGGGSDAGTGKLYLETDTFTGGSFSTFTVEETPPVDTATETFREPKIDLSGFSLRVGIRIRL